MLNLFVMSMWIGLLAAPCGQDVTITASHNATLRMDGFQTRIVSPGVQHELTMPAGTYKVLWVDDGNYLSRRQINFTVPAAQCGFTISDNHVRVGESTAVSEPPVTPPYDKCTDCTTQQSPAWDIQCELLWRQTCIPHTPGTKPPFPYEIDDHEGGQDD